MGLTRRTGAGVLYSRRYDPDFSEPGSCCGRQVKARTSSVWQSGDRGCGEATRDLFAHFIAASPDGGAEVHRDCARRTAGRIAYGAQCGFAHARIHATPTRVRGCDGAGGGIEQRHAVGSGDREGQSALARHEGVALGEVPWGVHLDDARAVHLARRGEPGRIEADFQQQTSAIDEDGVRLVRSRTTEVE